MLALIYNLHPVEVMIVASYEKATDLFEIVFNRVIKPLDVANWLFRKEKY